MMRPSSVGRFLSNRIHVDYIGALVASLLLGSLVCVVRSMGGVRVGARFWAESLLLASVSYVAVAVLLRRYWTGTLDRILPRFILTGILGSLLLMGFISIPEAVETWGSHYQVEKTLTEFVSVRLEDVRSASVVFCLISLPILAAFHYGGNVLTALRQWHNGPDRPLSIIRKSAPKN